MLKKLLCNGSHTKEKLSFKVPSPTINFSHALNNARSCLQNENEKERKIIILDLIMQVIRDDLKTSKLASLFYNCESCDPSKRGSFFPISYHDKNGIKTSTYILTPEGRRKVSLADDCVVISPWSQEQCNKTILTDFKYDANIHFSTYYKPLNICRIENGSQSISSAMGHKKGIILSKEIDISHSFPHIFSDGLHWYNTHTKENLSPVLDFRIAIIFELAKIKHKFLSP